jgi:hypothetical protein
MELHVSVARWLLELRYLAGGKRGAGLSSRGAQRQGSGNNADSSVPKPPTTKVQTKSSSFQKPVAFANLWVSFLPFFYARRLYWFYAGISQFNSFSKNNPPK